MGKCKLGGIISTHTPLAGRDKPLFFVKNGFWHISTHTPLAGRDQPVQLRLHIVRISTHTPLAGRDTANLQALGLEQDFYSHAPRGARHDIDVDVWRQISFLLTRPSRGATAFCCLSRDYRRFLLTRPSRGATNFGLFFATVDFISTHTPLAGRDQR